MKMRLAVLVALLAIFSSVPVFADRASDRNNRQEQRDYRQEMRRQPQGQIIWAAPGERLDYYGRVDGYTGSPMQYIMESNRSLITGPLRDLRGHLEETRNSRSTRSRSSRYGEECYGGSDCGPYIMGRRYLWSSPAYGGLHININFGRKPDVIVVSNPNDSRDQRDGSRTEEPREFEPRRSAETGRVNPRPMPTTVINSTGKAFSFRASVKHPWMVLECSGPNNSTSVDDPTAMEVKIAKADCDVQSEPMGSENTLKLTCK